MKKIGYFYLIERNFRYINIFFVFPLFILKINNHINLVSEVYITVTLVVYFKNKSTINLVSGVWVMVNLCKEESTL